MRSRVLWPGCENHDHRVREARPRLLSRAERDRKISSLSLVVIPLVAQHALLGELPAFPSSWSGPSVGSGVLCSSVLCWGDCVFVKLSMRSMSAALPTKDCHWLTKQVQTESTERPSRNKKLPNPFWKAMASTPLGVFILNWFVIWRKHNT